MKGATKTYYFDIFSYNRAVDERIDHGTILSAKHVQDQIVALLKGNEAPTHTTITRLKPTRQSVTRKVTAQSPVLLHLFDSSGRHTGPLGALGAEEQIPNSRYDRGTGIQTLYFDDADTYSVQIVGTGSGVVHLTVEELLGEALVETVTYSGIPVTPVSTAQFDFATMADSHRVHVDANGDGRVDFVSRPDSEMLRGDLDGDRDVDLVDLGYVLAVRNTSAVGTRDPRDLDSDGRITTLDGRKLQLLCTRARCAAN